MVHRQGELMVHSVEPELNVKATRNVHRIRASSFPHLKNDQLVSFFFKDFIL